MNTRWLESSCTGLALAVLCYARAEPNGNGGHLQNRIMKTDAKTIDVKFVTCCLFFSSLQNILTRNTVVIVLQIIIIIIILKHEPFYFLLYEPV